MLIGIIKSVDNEKIVIEESLNIFTKGVIGCCKMNNITTDLKCMPFIAREKPTFQYEPSGLHYKQKVYLVVKIPKDYSKREYLKGLINKAVCMQCQVVCVDNEYIECVLFGDVMIYDKAFDF